MDSFWHFVDSLAKCVWPFGQGGLGPGATDRIVSYGAAAEEAVKREFQSGYGLIDPERCPVWRDGTPWMWTSKGFNIKPVTRRHPPHSDPPGLYVGAFYTVDHHAGFGICKMPLLYCKQDNSVQIHVFFLSKGSKR